MFTCLLDANIAELGTGWAIYATGAMLLQNTSFVAGDRNASNELALFISTSAPIDYGSCTPGSTPGGQPHCRCIACTRPHANQPLSSVRRRLYALPAYLSRMPLEPRM